MESLLVTGGGGYIGSHAVKALLIAGRTVTVLDDFRRGHRAPLALLAERHPGRLHILEAPLADTARITKAMRAHRVDAVLHFAALAYVAESVDRPLDYFDCNVAGLTSLLRSCSDATIRRFIFSSSCSVYGDLPATSMPLRETSPTLPISPYGWTKLIGERLLEAHACAEHRAGRDFSCTMLRYFNVAGADADGLLGEDHRPETHLIPRAILAALGQGPPIDLCGDDFPTPDGTPIRDFIHVDDLVDAHLRALDQLRAHDVRRYNISIGAPNSVRQVMDTVSRVLGRPVPVRAAPRRPGDPAIVHADASLARRELGWSPRHRTLDTIVESAFRWFRDHPEGYPS